MITDLQPQMDSIKKGINLVIPQEILKILTLKEFSNLLFGCDDIDIEQMRMNTNYVGFDEKDEIIQWFWDLLQQYNLE